MCRHLHRPNAAETDAERAILPTDIHSRVDAHKLLSGRSRSRRGDARVQIPCKRGCNRSHGEGSSSGTE